MFLCRFEMLFSQKKNLSIKSWNGGYWICAKSFYESLINFVRKVSSKMFVKRFEMICHHCRIFFVLFDWLSFISVIKIFVFFSTFWKMWKTHFLVSPSLLFIIRGVTIIVTVIAIKFFLCFFLKKTKQKSMFFLVIIITSSLSDYESNIQRKIRQQ